MIIAIRVLRVLIGVVAVWQCIGILPAITWLPRLSAVTIGMAAVVLFKLVVLAICVILFRWLGRVKRKNEVQRESISDISISVTVLVVIVVAVVLVALFAPSNVGRTNKRTQASVSANGVTNTQLAPPAVKAFRQRPVDANDIKAWGTYLVPIVEANAGNVTNPPYVYFVPTAANPANAAMVATVQEQLSTMVRGTVLPGNMVAVGGPSSATTAQLLEVAFQNAAPGSFRGVVILFIGDEADEAAVREAVAPSGAIFKFAQS